MFCSRAKHVRPKVMRDDKTTLSCQPQLLEVKSQKRESYAQTRS
jgi:hypothetical protein